MSYDNPTRSSSSGAVIAIVIVVGLLLLGGLLVLGLAGLFFFRLSAAPQRNFAPMPPVLVEERPARLELQPAVEVTAEAPVPAPAALTPLAASVRTLTIRLDAQGSILIGDETVDVDALTKRVGDAREDGKPRLEVLVEVDGQCLFQHVAAVQAACQEAGVESVRVRVLQGKPD